MTVKCPSCGAESTSAYVCTACGTPLAPKSSRPNPTVQGPASPAAPLPKINLFVQPAVPIPTAEPKTFPPGVGPRSAPPGGARAVSPQQPPVQTSSVMRMVRYLDEHDQRQGETRRRQIILGLIILSLLAIAGVIAQVVIPRYFGTPSPGITAPQPGTTAPQQP